MENGPALVFTTTFHAHTVYIASSKVLHMYADS